MIKNLIIGTLAAILITAIGFSVYNVLAPGAGQETAQGAAPLREVVAQQNQTGVQAQDQTQAAEPVAQADAGALPQTAAALPQTAAQANVAQSVTGQVGAGQAGGGRGRRGQSSDTQAQGGGAPAQNGAAPAQSGAVQPGTGVPAPQNGLSEWITLHGVVSSFTPPSLVLILDDGQVITVEAGNQSFLSSLGVQFLGGEGVTVTGFYDQNGGFTVGTLTLDASGQSFSLRDELGRPAWRGGANH